MAAMALMGAGVLSRRGCRSCREMVGGAGDSGSLGGLSGGGVVAGTSTGAIAAIG